MSYRSGSATVHGTVTAAVAATGRVIGAAGAVMGMACVLVLPGNLGKA